MFLYVPKLLIRLLEAFYWGLSVTSCWVRRPRPFGCPINRGSLLPKHHGFRSWEEGALTSGRMAQFWLLQDGGLRGQEEEEAEEAEKTQLDPESDFLWTLDLFFRKPLGPSSLEQSLALHSAASVLDLVFTPAQGLHTSSSLP